jgi:NTE family protein
MGVARIKVAIACQGGGSQTAFTAGVLKALAEEQVQREVEVVAISGTSGGSVCAALLWYSYWKGERPVWERLIAFWQDNTAQGFAEQQFNRVLIESLRAVNRGLLPMFQVSPSSPVMQAILPLMTAGSRRVFTEFPELLRKYIDFAEVAAWGARAGPPVLIIGAANVNTGQLVKFSTAREPLRIEHILASSAVPNIFPAVMIDGQGYWDGLFSDNPPVLELIRPRTVGPGNIPEEIWLIKINPTARGKVPAEPAEILDRRNQLEGNISLFQQLDQIGMINDLILGDAFRPEFLARYDIRAPVRIPKSFEADPDRPYHIPCIEMPKHLHDRLDYEGKIDRSAANIDWLLEHGEAAGRAFLAERRAAIAASPLPRQAPRADRS